MAWDVRITSRGQDILATRLGGGEIALSKAACGSAVSTIAEMEAMTDMTDVKQEISRVTESVAPDGLQIGTRVIGKDAADPYTLRQIGIYADYNGADVLMVIAQTSEPIEVVTDVEDWAVDFIIKITVNGTAGAIALDFDDVPTEGSGRLLTSGTVYTALLGKVDAVEGYGLSEESYSAEEKAKLAGIPADAAANVNADWEAIGGDAEILNKPTTLSGYGITLSDPFFVTKLNAVLAAAEYSDAATYAAGAYCTYSGGLYRCVSEISTAETWTAVHWAATTIGGELVTLAAAKADKAATLAGYGITDAYTIQQIDAIVSSVYKPSGSVTFANLPPLTTANLGRVYDVTDEFTTTVDFVEGAGKTYPGGTNVAIVDIDGVLKYDVLAGLTDLSAYVLAVTVGALADLTTTDKTSIVSAINELVTSKVDAVQGKRLSTEDYTTAEQIKLAGIEAGAQVNPSAFTGATAQAAGTAGLVPAPAAGDDGAVLRGDGSWTDFDAAVTAIIAREVPDGWNVPFGGESDE